MRDANRSPAFPNAGLLDRDNDTSIAVCLVAMTQFCASPFYGPADALSPDNEHVAKELVDDPLERIVTTGWATKIRLPEPVYRGWRDQIGMMQWPHERDRWLLPPTEPEGCPWRYGPRISRNIEFLTGYRPQRDQLNDLLPGTREIRGEIDWNWNFTADPNGSVVRRFCEFIPDDRPGPFQGTRTADWLPKPEPFPPSETTQSSSR